MSRIRVLDVVVEAHVMHSGWTPHGNRAGSPVMFGLSEINGRHRAIENSCRVSPRACLSAPMRTEAPPASPPLVDCRDGRTEKS